MLPPVPRRSFPPTGVVRGGATAPGEGSTRPIELAIIGVAVDKHRTPPRVPGVTDGSTRVASEPEVAPGMPVVFFGQNANRSAAFAAVIAPIGVVDDVVDCS